MSEKLFTVYKSSAGSGKTYTLAQEYLLLALSRPDKFKRILAVTFTNKATQEMKERIVGTLADFSKGNLEGMGNYIMKQLKLDKLEMIERSKALLASILHNFSRFSIQTIDTFFQSVMRSFSRELGLQGDGELQLDSSEAREQVIDLLLEDLSDNQQLRDWLLEFSSDKLENAKSWDVRKDILDFSNQLTNEAFLSIEQELLLSVRDGNSILKYKAKLQKVVVDFEKEMQLIGKSGLRFIESQGLEIDDFSNKYGGAAGYFYKLSEGEKFEPGKRVISAIEDEGQSLAAKKAAKREFILGVAPQLVALLAEAVACYDNKYAIYITSKAILKNVYNLGILWLYQKKLVEYKQEEGILFISDATLFLQRIIGQEETPFIYEKMGAFYDHFLIDEFQDTSAFQWNNFKPLINNSLDQGYKNLVVGDVKQSIYRWRGGDWRLLLSQLKEDIRAHAYEDKVLGRNFRSAPQVIDFNNKLFHELPALLQEELQGKLTSEGSPELLEMIEALSGAYKQVKQEKKEHYSSLGHIAIQLFEKDTDSEADWKEQAMLKLAKDFEQLQDNGIALSEMAILVRNAKHGKEINDFLMHYQKENPSKKYRYDVISNESLYLGASPAINFLLNCFRYLYATKNRIALAQLIHYYHKTILKEAVSEDALFLACHKHQPSEAVNKLLPAEFVANQQRLLNMNLLDLSEQLIQYFSLGSQPSEIPYLQAFQDVLLEYANKGNIQDFLDWWENNQHKYAVKIPESADAVRLMTIHKSKGLQFKVVFVPFLDWTVNHGTRGPLLWLAAGKEGMPSGVPFMPIKHARSALENSLFANEYWIEEVKSYLDNMNLLYVAFTRAEQALFASGQAATSTGQMVHFVEQVLSKQAEWDDANKSYHIGEIADIAVNHDDGASQTESLLLNSYPSADWSSKLAVKTGKAIKLSEERQQINQKINIGLLVHDVFSKMKRLADQPKVMRALWAENSLSEEELTQVDKLVTENINQHRQLHAWFETDWEVRTEVAIIDPAGKDMRLDRVHLSGDKAEIIDFKTGLEKAADKAQLLQYKKALAAMGYQQVTASLAYLNPFKVVEVN
jgi:ATP-dependent helicase/nuclease subunit A